MNIKMSEKNIGRSFYELTDDDPQYGPNVAGAFGEYDESDLQQIVNATNEIDKERVAEFKMSQVFNDSLFPDQGDDVELDEDFIIQLVNKVVGSELKNQLNQNLHSFIGDESDEPKQVELESMKRLVLKVIDHAEGDKFRVSMLLLAIHKKSLFVLPQVVVNHLEKQLYDVNSSE